MSAPPALPDSSASSYFIVRYKISRPSGYYLICTRDAGSDRQNYGFRVPAEEFNRAVVNLTYDPKNMRNWQPVSQID
ncbi:hypothetical protein OpiT1DRAFT_02251 [Opitutaceae bacterium TAV1]|nr:hypothetical protein OpiT1DRAFT_02251 [Opitutaceae bacterium TAV1]